ncbi:hypothetical protein LINPERPRIM_LOCUS8900 [Linum perenne]
MISRLVFICFPFLIVI